MYHWALKLRRIVAPAEAAIPGARSFDNACATSALRLHQLETELPTPKLQKRNARKYRVHDVPHRNARAAHRLRQQGRQRSCHQKVLDVLDLEPPLRELD